MRALFAGIVLACGYVLSSVAVAGINEWSSIGPSTAPLTLIASDGDGPYPLYASDGTRLYRTRNEVTWTPVTSYPGFAVPCPTKFSPIGKGIVFVQTTCNGFYRSDDGGNTWTTLPPPPAWMVSSAVDPRNTAVIYALFYGLGAYKSSDGGTTWTPLPVGWPQFGLSGVIVDSAAPSNVYIYGPRSAVLKSTDSGAHWSVANAGLPDPATPTGDVVGMVQFGHTLVIATASSGFFKSDNAGASWTSSNGGRSPLILHALAASRGPSPMLYAVGFDGFDNVIRFFASSDGGNSWRATAAIAVSGVGTIAVSARSPTVVFAVTDEALATSTDGTNSWTIASPSSGLPTETSSRVLVDSRPSSVLYGTTVDRAFGYAGMNSGQQWSRLALADGHTIQPVSTSQAQAGVVYGALGNIYVGILFRSVDSGNTWTQLLVPTYALTTFMAVVDSPTSGVIYAAGNQTFARFGGAAPFLQRSDDSGAHWTDISAGLPSVSTSQVALTAIAIDPADAHTAYVAAANRIYKTTNGGNLWMSASNGLPEDVISALVRNPMDTNVIYAAVGSSVYVSSDRGASWTSRSTGLPGPAVTALAMDARNMATLYAGVAGQGIYGTTNGGLDWAGMSAGLISTESKHINNIAIDEGKHALYVGTAAGIFAYTPDDTGTLSSVVEFYNESLDHYVISANAQEIADLDAGVHPGWRRTGQTFIGFNGKFGNASPVCRFYIPPAYGDSHFYSASPAECGEVQAKFPFFIFESPNVFYIDLPNTSAGTCPAGDSPVYRVWNDRVDTNHRYVSDASVRDLMVALGGIAEGYGPGAVIMCSAR